MIVVTGNHPIGFWGPTCIGGRWLSFGMGVLMLGVGSQALDAVVRTRCYPAAASSAKVGRVGGA
eukprot:8339568-Pyramimonas_sp.AAC.2